MKTKLIIGLVTAFLLFSITTTAQTGLPFTPNCVWETEPTFGEWTEVDDASNKQTYCVNPEGLGNDVMFIRQPVSRNFQGEPFTSTGATMKKDTYLEEQGNIRNVELQFQYYAPFMATGECVHTSINTRATANDKHGRTIWNSGQSVMIGNDNANITTGSKLFNVGYVDFNQMILDVGGCGEWHTFKVDVSNFVNEYGGSFTGRSKFIQAFGLEVTNLYIANITLIGTEENIDVPIT